MTNVDETINYKILLLGNSAVGKTSLFKKVTTGVFSDKNISTIGMDRRRLPFQVPNLENGVKKVKNIDISLLDTAGQERFRSITKSYFKGADGIFLLYDVTNRESFDQVENWINSIHEQIGDHSKSKYIIVLFGNKIDLVNENLKPRLVSEEEAKQKCVDKNIEWGGECSAKTSSKEDFMEKFQKYVEKIYEKVGDNNVGEQKTANLDMNRNRRQRCCA